MSVFTLIVHQYVYYWQTDGWKWSIEKAIVDNLWIVGESINNKYTDKFIDEQSAQILTNDDNIH